MKATLLVLFIAGLTCLTAQDRQHSIDSLRSALKSARHDTVQANLIVQICRQMTESSPDSSIIYGQQALAPMNSTVYKKQIAQAYFEITALNRGARNKLLLLEMAQKTMALRRDLNDQEDLAASWKQIALIYSDQGNYPESLKSYFRAVKIIESTTNYKLTSNIYSNIGTIFQRQGNYQEALNYHSLAVTIGQRCNDTLMKAYTINNLGETYRLTGNYTKALELFQQAIAIIGDYDDSWKGYFLNNLGDTYKFLEQYPQALESNFAALRLQEKHNDRYGILNSRYNLGGVYLRMKRYKEAHHYLQDALALATTDHNFEILRDSHHLLSEVNRVTGKYADALEHYTIYISMRDSTMNSDKSRQITQLQMENEFSQKESLAKAEQEKKDAIQQLVRNGLITGIAAVFLFAVVFFRQRNNIKKGKSQSDNLLLNILPAEVAEELKAKGTADAKLFDNVTVLFTDFKSFTTVSEQLSPQELVNELHACFKAFDEICTKNSIEKIKTIGDAYLAVCGLPLADEKHAENVVHAALEIREFMANRSKELGAKTFEIRIGINSGSVVAGIVGVKKFAYDIWGDTVNTAARMEQHSEAGKINISETTHALVKDQFTCDYRGEIDAKNKGKLTMYFVEKA